MGFCGCVVKIAHSWFFRPSEPDAAGLMAHYEAFQFALMNPVLFLSGQLPMREAGERVQVTFSSQSAVGYAEVLTTARRRTPRAASFNKCVSRATEFRQGFFAYGETAPPSVACAQLQSLSCPLALPTGQHGVLADDCIPPELFNRSYFYSSCMAE